MKLITKVSGTMRGRKMVKAPRCGWMARCTKATGLTTKLMGEVDSSTLMETFMKESGRRTKLTVKVTTNTLMEPSTRESGLKINSMAKARRFGQIAPTTRGAI